MYKWGSLESEKMSTKANSLDFQYILIMTILMFLLNNYERWKRCFIS